MPAKMTPIYWGRAARNQQKIFKYFSKNPMATKVECAEDLGLSKSTVTRHCSEIRKAFVFRRNEEKNIEH